MTNPIVPTVGRVVLFRSWDHPEDQPALVTKVWSNDCINVHVLADAAPAFTVTSCTYDDNDTPNSSQSWHWMSYQKAVAAGTVQPTQHAVQGAA